jgi:flavin reductase (DIM6/NTAB) family NADH-FMN oxidoreductase RutF
MIQPRPPATALHDARELRNALGAFATGVAIVTAAADDGAHGLTINSFASVSLDPPLVLWSLDKRSHSLAAFEVASTFAVNVLGRHQVDLARRFARPAASRFAGVSYAEGLNGAPLIHDCIACFECRRVAAHEGGDHIVFVGRIERYRADHRSPLVFSRGEFGGFAP